MLLNERRRHFIDHYRTLLLAPGGWRKVNPDSLYRALKTFVVSRNLQGIGADEMLREGEAAVEALGRLAEPQPQKPLSKWLPIVSSPDVNDLGELFRQHGSDKSTEHDYFEVYGSILDGKRDKPLKILEIGLGTNNLAIPSNMGLRGRPGASLRAFRDWAPHAIVVGADVDRGILFQEERITTHWVDQTDPASLKALAEKAAGRYDLIIDDGLHLPYANFNTVEALLPLLSETGTLVVEDIVPIHLHYWHVAAKVLSSYDTYLSERRGGYIFVIRKRNG